MITLIKNLFIGTVVCVLAIACGDEIKLNPLKNEFSMEGEKHFINFAHVTFYAHPDIVEYVISFAGFENAPRSKDGENVLQTIIVCTPELNNTIYVHKDEESDLDNFVWTMKSYLGIDKTAKNANYEGISESGQIEIEEIDFNAQKLKATFEFTNEDGKQIKGAYEGAFDYDESFKMLNFWD